MIASERVSFALDAARAEALADNIAKAHRQTSAIEFARFDGSKGCPAVNPNEFRVDSDGRRWDSGQIAGLAWAQESRC